MLNVISLKRGGSDLTTDGISQPKKAKKKGKEEKRKK